MGSFCTALPGEFVAHAGERRREGGRRGGRRGGQPPAGHRGGAPAAGAAVHRALHVGPAGYCSSLCHSRHFVNPSVLKSLAPDDVAINIRRTL